MNLNIGCGGNEYRFHSRDCEINIDIQKPLTKINGFVCCDAHFLPFQARVFEQTFCDHVIEHLANPYHALQEMRRVTSKEIRLTFPHWISPFSFFEKRHRWIIFGFHFFLNPNYQKDHKALIKVYSIDKRSRKFHRYIFHRIVLTFERCINRSKIIMTIKPLN